MTDPYILEVAGREREVARVHLQWSLDLFRLHVGMVEVVPIDDRPIARYRRYEEHPEPTMRFVPLFNGTGIFIRDVR